VRTRAETLSASPHCRILTYGTVVRNTLVATGRGERGGLMHRFGCVSGRLSGLNDRFPRDRGWICISAATCHTFALQ
jgi:hypothetical protein